ncbi:hypothetical protein GCK72_016469 [Caenorhabditis remanei]|uniref:Uncharacterized protein n=1 Tax=Caenorhabditis remanei TaxID=31234 RepID=A0A6A5G5Q2_CAERE|nr:hypothetical protein GCK72_016469 [Caenorhabditis remanei]KAF1749924.1 hypothetical protein GCK72_016469 [Caenorhabditis remanei]
MTRCSINKKPMPEENMVQNNYHEDESLHKARIFICDRRRAILEGVSTLPAEQFATRTPKNSESSDTTGSASSSSIASTSSSDADSLSSSSKTKTKQQQTEQKQQQQMQQQQLQQQQHDRRRNVSGTSSSTDSSGLLSKTTTYISDQYSDTDDPNWAFAFNFQPWIREYDICEVHFKNFCSFLEREKIEDPMSPSSFKGRTAYYENHMNDKATALALADLQIVRLSPPAAEEMRNQSAGRIERLAEKLRDVRDVHYTFKDSVCYGARPPVTIFYFLEMMHLNIRALTFDHVQAATQIELHEVLDMANLHRLTVIQPQQRQTIMVREELFEKWIKLADKDRKRISIHLNGCHEFRPQNLYVVVQAWLNHPKPVEFKQISIDGGSYKYNEFIYLIERLHDIMEKRPPRSPMNRSFGNEQNEHSIVLDKVCRIPHPQDRSVVIVFKYCRLSRKMVLTIEKELSPKSPVPTLSPVATLARLARPHSAASVLTSPMRKISSSLKSAASPTIPTNNNNNNCRQSLGRPLSHDPCHMTGCRENAGSNMFTRIVSFLGTSS